MKQGGRILLSYRPKVIDFKMSVENEKEGLQKSESVTNNTSSPEVDSPQEATAVGTKEILPSKKVEEAAKAVVTEENDIARKEEVIEIPEVDYSDLSQEALLDQLKSLLAKYPVQLIKDQVEAIRSQFNENFNAAAEASKAEFLKEGGNEIDFYYSTPLKKQFNEAYFDYKDKRNKYYKNVQTNLENNLKTRLQLIEDLKVLVADNENSVSKKFATFNEIKEKWHQAGAIPRDKNNTVWNTYYHHVDRFYEIVHLDREFRDKDYKNNLEQKLMIIDRAKELVQETSINRAFRELQVLHKIWKEELGPVAKEYKDVIWDKFSELTREIHDKRQAYFAEQDAKQAENLVARREIITQIAEVTNLPKSTHKEWQEASKKVEELHESFKKVGRVPNEFKNIIWDEFREAERVFNRSKNEYYKQIKGDQLENLAKKKALIELAEANKNSEDFEATTELMKKIQSDWKKIGHVPRKDSDKIWNQFKEACNYYFDRISSKKEEANKEQEASYEKKVSFIENIKGEALDTIESITDKIAEWKTLGSVPYKKRDIEQKFSEVLDGLFSKLNISKKESELLKFENRLAEIVAQNDERLLQGEKTFIKKKQDEVKSEILQLQNNLQFFKHADTSNPLVADVYKRIAKHEDDLEIWEQKWRKIKSL